MVRTGAEHSYSQLVLRVPTNIAVHHINTLTVVKVIQCSLVNLGILFSLHDHVNFAPSNLAVLFLINHTDNALVIRLASSNFCTPGAETACVRDFGLRSVWVCWFSLGCDFVEFRRG